MFVRLGLFALALVTLLISIVVEAQPLADQIPQSLVSTYSESACFQDVAIIWLHVVKDGKVKKEAFEPEKLAGSPVISVDGYVTGIVLLSNTPLNVSVNRKPMNPIHMNADGYYKLKYYGNISREDFWSTFWPTERQVPKNEKIQGRYSIFPKVPGDALSREPEFQIALNQKGVSRDLTIRQNAGIKFDLRKILPTVNGAPDFYYLGNNLSQLNYASKKFKERLDALLTGIQAIEQSTGGKIVERVHIIDYDGTHNAYSCNDENVIWLYNKVFWEEPLQELRVIAEHETMHIVSDRLGLSKSSRMRALYAELMGFDLLSRERFYVLSSGTPPPVQPGVSSTSSKIFDFINEVNFIRGMNGGHSQDNVDEFCASFLHTLIYIDRLETLLGEPVKSRDGIFTQLSCAEQANLFKDYERILQTVTAETKIEIPLQFSSFFQTCHIMTHQANPNFRQVADLVPGSKAP